MASGRPWFMAPHEAQLVLDFDCPACHYTKYVVLAQTAVWFTYGPWYEGVEVQPEQPRLYCKRCMVEYDLGSWIDMHNRWSWCDGPEYDPDLIRVPKRAHPKLKRRWRRDLGYCGMRLVVMVRRLRHPRVRGG